MQTRVHPRREELKTINFRFDSGKTVRGNGTFAKQTVVVKVVDVRR
jgi:hypothetical protein